MTVAAPTDTAETVPDPFDLSLPSPLPALAAGATPARDPVAEAERLVAQADAAADDPRARVRARLALVDAWLALDAVGPALEAARQATRLAPDHAGALATLGALLTRAGQHREAAAAFEARARAERSVASWSAAARAWLRADDLAEAERAVAALVPLAPADPRTLGLGLTVGRLRAVAVGDPRVLVPRLLEAAVQARHRDDAVAWRALAADAWLSAHGHAGGELLAEALVATSARRAAVYVLVETAARGLPRDDAPGAEAARLLARAARLAEEAGHGGEAVGARTVLALVPALTSVEAREALRDQLAECERPLELAARLRVDARRAAPAARAAAWKGVAAIELPHRPDGAAQALVEALRHEPDDPEAVALLTTLADDPAAESAIRDALALVARDPALAPAVRARLHLWLGRLEEGAGDPAAAQLAYGRIPSPDAEAREALAGVRAASAALVAAADAALKALTTQSEPAAHEVAALLARFGRTPGAFRDLRAVARALGPLALQDERVADLWLRIARRVGDAAHLDRVLRRVATRCAVPAARVRAALECAAAVDAAGTGAAEAGELLELLLDELPGEREAAVALAGLAEHARDPALARAALRALARTAADGRERDVVARFTGTSGGTFAVFAQCLGEPTSSRERTEMLGRLHELLGDTWLILAQRTRALLAQTGPQDDGLAIARRFAAFDPASAEATIAWFGAATLAGDLTQAADAAVAVARSSASARDVAAVARTALTRLAGRGAHEACVRVALAAAEVGLADRALRGLAVDVADRHAPPADAVRLLEAAAAGTGDGLAERQAALRKVAAVHRAAGHVAGEVAALRRVQSLAPGEEESLGRLATLLERTGDRAGLAGLLALRLATVLEPGARRRLHLTLAAALATATPPRADEAAAALDRYAQERGDDEARGEVVRALVALGRADLAVERLARWAATAPDRDAVVLGALAARLAHERLGDGARALAILRGLLARPAHVPEVLPLAERVAADAGLVDAMLAIFDDLTAAAAGEHGRHAIAYRRAAFRERVGDHAAALAEHAALLERYPAVGATFSAIERLAERTGRYDVLVAALGRLAAAAPAPETRARFLLRAADVARTRGRDARASLELTVRAFEALPGPEAEAAVVGRAKEVRAVDADAARRALEALADHALAAGNQTWDDVERGAHALHAAALAVDAGDTYRLAAAVGLHLRQHPAPATGRAEVLALLARTHAGPALREAAEAVPAMEAARVRPPSAPPAEAATATPDAPAGGFVDLAAELSSELSSELAGGPDASAAAPSLRPPADDTVLSAPPPLPTPPPLPGATPAAAPSAAAPATEVPLASLRATAEQGDDTAAADLADRLARDRETLDEALAIQRRRYGDDPTRLDALDAMVNLYAALGMTQESAALRSVLGPLRGESPGVVAPDLQDLVGPLDGVTRVLFPPRFAPFAELGALLWEALGGRYRRESLRSDVRPDARPDARPGAVSDDLARMFASAVRLLQLPRATWLAVRDEVRDGAQPIPGAPSGVAVAALVASDTPLARYVIGRALEGTRASHLLIACLPPDEGQRLVQALVAAFGAHQGGALPGPIAALASTLQESLTPRAQHRLVELVDDLGQRLTYPAWRDAVELARMRAGMLLAGDFEVAAAQVLAGQRGGPTDAARGLVASGALRELARFATSEEYLLLRWSVDAAARRRR